MPTIYLVRHAQYDNPRGILPGRLPVELSKEGIKEVERLREFFKDKNIQTIYSSAVLRCKQTSHIIANEEIPITFDKRILESFSAYQGYWTDNTEHFFGHRDELGGESLEDILKRMADFWQDEIMKKSKQFKGNVIICSHGDPLYGLYLYLIQKTHAETKKQGYQEKASVRPIEVEKNGEIQIGELITQADLLSR